MLDCKPATCKRLQIKNVSNSFEYPDSDYEAEVTVIKVND